MPTPMRRAWGTTAVSVLNRVMEDRGIALGVRDEILSGLRESAASEAAETVGIAAAEEPVPPSAAPAPVRPGDLITADLLNRIIDYINYLDLRGDWLSARLESWTAPSDSEAGGGDSGTTGGGTTGGTPGGGTTGDATTTPTRKPPQIRKLSPDTVIDAATQGTLTITGRNFGTSQNTRVEAVVTYKARIISSGQKLEQAIRLQVKSITATQIEVGFSAINLPAELPPGSKISRIMIVVTTPVDSDEKELDLD